MTFAELLEIRAAERGEDVFLLFGDERISHAELDRRANRIANGLAALGVGPGKGVAILMGNSPAWLEVFFATQKLGAYAVPINVALRGEGLAYVLDHSDSMALVADADLAGVVEPLREFVPKLRHWIVAPGEAPDARVPEGTVPLGEIASGPADRPAAHATDGTTALLLYTSGTTGLPKGVVMTHGSFNYTGIGLFAELGYRPGDVLYTCLPLFHANAQYYSFASAIAGGAGISGLRTRYSKPLIVLMHGDCKVSTKELARQAEDRIADVDLAVVVIVQRILARGLERAEELEPEVVDGIGDVDRAVGIHVAAHELRLRRAGGRPDHRVDAQAVRVAGAAAIRDQEVDGVDAFDKEPEPGVGRERRVADESAVVLDHGDHCCVVSRDCDRDGCNRSLR